MKSHANVLLVLSPRPKYDYHTASEITQRISLKQMLSSYRQQFPHLRSNLPNTEFYLLRRRDVADTQRKSNLNEFVCVHFLGYSLFYLTYSYSSTTKSWTWWEKATQMYLFISFIFLLFDRKFFCRLNRWSVI